MIDDATAQIYARLQAHEFFLEIVYARWFAQLSEDDAKQIADEIKRLMRITHVSLDADPEVVEEYALQISRDAGDLGERFLGKVERRASSIRQGLTEAGSSQ